MENFEQDNSYKEEFVTLLPEQNEEDNENFDNIEHSFNQINDLIFQKTKSFSLNSNNFKSFIELDASLKSSTQNSKNAEKDSILLEQTSKTEALKETNNSETNLNSKSNTSKVKFKNVLQYKKDVVIKKLLKTIDVMNQELNKRDQLIMTMEKENSILHCDKENSLKNFKTYSNEQAYYLVEVSRLKQEVLNYKNENELLNQKIKFIEKQLNDTKKEEATFASEYKEILSPKSSKLKRKSNNSDDDFQSISRLRVENEELNQLNQILKTELEKLSKQIDLIEKRKHLEREISQNFEDLIKQKENLEQENKNLLNKIDVLRDEMKICLVNFQEEISEVKKTHDNEIIDLKLKLNEEETKTLEIINNFEAQLKDSNLVIEKLDEERTYLVKTLNTFKEDKNQLIDDLDKKLKWSEKNFDNLKKEYDKYKTNCESLYEINLGQQKQIQKLFEDLDSKTASNEKLNMRKVDELKRLKQSFNLVNEKLKFQQMKHEADMEELRKKYIKELDALKFSNEQMTIRNGELSRSNGELRKKVQNMENELKELNDKFLSTKHSNDLLTKQKKELKEDLDRISFTYKKEIDVLEKLRDEYLKKNNSQQTAIDQMLEQVKNFQKEIDALIKRNEDLDERLKRKIASCDLYKKKYSEIKLYLKTLLYQNEQKQQEANLKLNQNLTCFINNLIKKIENLDEND